MPTAPRPARGRSQVSRRDFLKRTGLGTVALSPLLNGVARRAGAQPAAAYPDWIAPSTKPPKRGKLITRASPWDPPALDPRLTNSVGLFQIASLTSNRLVRFPFSDEAANSTDLTIKGDLAESWQNSPDHRVWTFKLRKGVKWQNVAPLNGRELVAQDIKYCYEAYAKDGVQSFTFQEIEGIETPDKYTVRIHLKMPNTMFLQNLAEPVSVIFAREVLEEDGDLKKRLIGTGPYIMKEHTRKVRVVLARNPDYFDQGRPYIDEYHILSTPDAATRLAAFRSGQSDILFASSLTEVGTLKKTNPDAQVEEYKTVQAVFGLALAQDKPPFNDVRVRRAISMAIDRQKQVDTLYGGHAILGWGIPYFYFQDKAPTAAQLGPYWQYKPAEAKKLLSEAGHPNGFETTLFYYEYFPEMSSQVQLVQQDLKKNLNIEIKISKLDYTTFYTRYAEGKWDGMAWGYKTGYATGLDEHTYQYMHSKSTKNYWRFADPVIDELVTKLRQTSDRNEQRTLTRRVLDREHDQVTRMWMPYDGGFLAWQPSLRNVGSLALRRNDGYGASTLARLWIDK
ncbi:MAG TPA: ABC transporter substrate-binding protein [Candidatus Bathyarchaeia archaeon]|nr:ABC transporter substrate-binding protein [Candidatus Bathyarchaeia archaeon]